jgi:hypothetical protein
MLEALETSPDECSDGLPRPVARGIRNATKLVASASSTRRASRAASKLRRAITRMRASALWAARLADRGAMSPDCVEMVFGQLGEAIDRAASLAEHP